MESSNSTKSKGSVRQTPQELVSALRQCAEQGWRCHLNFESGEYFESAYITATDWENEAVVIERVGERHLKPRLIFVKDLARVVMDWS